MKNLYLKDFYSKPKYIKKKNGYILCAIDGSKIEIPNTPLNREIFGSEGNQHKRKITRALLSGIYDVENHFFLDVEIEKYVSIVRKNRKSIVREWSPSNKYRTNYKTSF